MQGCLNPGMQAVSGLVVAAEDTQTKDSSMSAWPDWWAAGRWEVSRHKQGQVVESLKENQGV